jgi:hypothetical protein
MLSANINKQKNKIHGYEYTHYSKKCSLWCVISGSAATSTYFTEDKHVSAQYFIK